MIVTHRNGDLYSAATSLGIVAYNVDFEAAAQAIVNTVDGIELEDAYTLLQNPAPPGEWRATLAAAMASDLSTLDMQVEALAATNDQERQELKGQLEKIKSQVSAVSKQTEIESLRQEIRDRETEVKEALIQQFGDEFNPYWIKWATRAERARLAEMEARNE